MQNSRALTLGQNSVEFGVTKLLGRNQLNYRNCF